MPTRPKQSKGREPQPLSPAKRAAFWGITLALPFVFFLILEGGLRLGGYGATYPMFVPIEDHPEYMVQARDVSRRYFHQIKEAPTAPHDVFLTDKPEGALRLFVQGGSSAAGFPFYHGAAFSRMLKGRLQETLPGTTVEVVNTAMAAVNSFTLLDLADEIISQRPDAVLIYAGHNEYYGAFGVGSTESLGNSRWLVNTYLRLQNFRTVQLLRGGLSRLAAAGPGRQPGAPGDGTLMARMVRNQSIPYGSPEYERGLRQFSGNLGDLLARYRREGIPVFVGTLVANERDHAPFSSILHRDTDEVAWRTLYSRGISLLEGGDASGAVEAFETLVRQDSLAADAFHGLGRALEAAGDPAGALRAYRAASDRDALRFRAPGAFNAIIREVAAQHGSTVVDVEARFREAAPAGIIGRDEMLEHLHPTVDGYFLISDAFYHALLESPLLANADVRPVPTSIARGRVRLTPADSLVGIWRVRQLMTAWPFVPPGAPARSGRLEDTLRLDSPEKRIALDLLRARKNWLEATEELATEFERAGRIGEAIRAREAMIQGYPMLAGPYLGLAGLHTRQRDLDAAMPLYQEAIDRGEATGNAHGLLGALVLERGMRAADRGARGEAREHFERARSLLEASRARNPRNPQTLYNLSGAYAQLGRFDDSRSTAQALLQIQPNHAGGRQLIASLPAE
jgi:tetratricopeptide (TPR) repeat protein